MQATTHRLARILAAGVLGASIAAAAAPAFSDRGGQGHGQHAAPTAEQMQQRVQARLTRMAERLEIKASQQAAWDAYVQKRIAMVQARPQRPDRDADAPTVLRFRAGMAERRAKNLVALADATEDLRKNLDAAQQKVLDRMALRQGRHGARGSRGSHEHGGKQRGEHRRGERA